MTSVDGLWFDGQTSNQQQARLLWDGQQLQLLLANDCRPLDPAALCISPRLGNSPRSIELPEGGRFETRDNDGVDALIRATGSPGGGFWLHRLESQYRMVLLSVLLLLAFLVGLFGYGLPKGAEWLAYRLPADLLDQSASTSLALLDRLYLDASQLPPERQAALQTLLTPYLPQQDSFRYRLLFRQGGELGANAFALPDGSLILTDELIALSEQDEELIAVLAHEIGHVEYRHALRNSLQSSTVTLLGVLLLGDASGLSDLLVGLPTVLMHAAYSRDFEREADAYAIALLQRQGIAPGHFASLLERLEQSHRDPETTDPGASAGSGDGKSLGSYFSSHPPTRERAALARAAAEGD